MLILERAASTGCRRCRGGHAPAMTMSLVVDRLRKALRRRTASRRSRRAGVRHPAAALAPEPGRPRRGEAAARARPADRLRGRLRGAAPLVASPAAEHAMTRAAADGGRHLAPHRGHHEEGYHVYQGDEAVEAEVYRGSTRLERAIRANELEIHTSRRSTSHRDMPSAPRRCCAGAIPRPATFRRSRWSASPSAPASCRR